MSITFTSKGSFAKTESFLKRLISGSIYSRVDAIAARGTAALKSATPVDEGTTAAGWSHETVVSGGGCTITWRNSHIDDGVNIAIILQYGHGTGTGGYVAGRDYINPALQPIFKEISDSVWREVTRA